ncbi:F390 synthetase-related protein [Deinococcus aquiradiocola]|uniref:Coenzyme F390 synthetase n=1 Tax=Deinococcus aquiradiocola TaxID=393059 RepID=A0A917PGF8_9DEIO|nr:F390 synthetase-related protein [Deinococcus aquiradiocola]GGJ76394.1 coenzyme F390 synthetase [Deinococcus aquiradiocola]
MPDRLQVLLRALQERTPPHRAALEAHAERLARTQLPWLAAHSAHLQERFRAARLPVHAWRDLPPTGKAEMMANFDALNTEGVTLRAALQVARHAEDTRDFTRTLAGRSGPLTVGLSSGTSGTQGVFLVTRAERLRWAGAVLRHLLPPPWPGSLLRPHRVAFVLRAEGGLYRSVQGRHLQFHFLDLQRPLPDLAAQLTALDPTLLVGPPSVLRALRDAGARAAPQRVVSVAEVLEDDDRDALQAAFGPVVQVYQATEGLLALPCPHGRLHLNERHVHFDFEALGDGHVRPVLTDLRRRAQPFVRHRLDDLLVLGDACPCGHPARVVERVAGRQDDALLLQGPEGTVTVWPDFVRAALNRVPHLREYRAVQTGPATLSVTLDPCTPDTRAAAEHELRTVLARHGARHVTLETAPLVLPDLPLAAQGKRRRVTRAWTPPNAPALTPLPPAAPDDLPY